MAPKCPGTVESGKSPLSLSKCSHMDTRIYSLYQGSPTHCLLVAGVLFTKLRGRKANVRRFNWVGGYGGST